MIHLGDITMIHGYDIEPVDVITGGSPCQDLSVAGKGAGLAGARSGLFIKQTRIVKEMRYPERYGRADKLVCSNAERKPRFLVWENVQGAFSSNNGDDFRTVLEEVIHIIQPAFSVPRLEGGQKWTKSGAIDGDGWSVAWRTHDAQYWGVPQRRRRISLVADFGGQCAGEILFESEGLSGYSPESLRSWKRIARCPQACAGATGYKEPPIIDINGDVAGTLNAVDVYSQTLTGDVTKTLTSAASDADHVPCVIEPTVNNAGGQQTYVIQGSMIGRKEENGPQGNGVNEDISFTLNTVDRHAVYTTELSQGETDYTIRRLTPTECERLQGFPDGWTDIGEWMDSKGKKRKSSDTLRYKALGNSIALPYWAWMLKRMAEYLPQHATMGSLFDGIGGFPLCWEGINGKGTARWASEIEEYPIAVTKYHFPE